MTATPNANAPDTEEHWARKPENLDSDNLLWKQYNTYVDIFKFYVNVIWQVITWFYAITGAILVYYFDHVKDTRISDTLSYFLLS